MQACKVLTLSAPLLAPEFQVLAPDLCGCSILFKKLRIWGQRSRLKCVNVVQVVLLLQQHIVGRARLHLPEEESLISGRLLQRLLLLVLVSAAMLFGLLEQIWALVVRATITGMMWW